MTATPSGAEACLGAGLAETPALVQQTVNAPKPRMVDVVDEQGSNMAGHRKTMTRTRGHHCVISLYGSARRL